MNVPTLSSREKRGSYGLGLIIAIFLLLGVIYSVTVPLFEGPDEIWHYSFIHRIVEEGGLPVQTQQQRDVWLRQAGQPPLYHLLAAALTAPIDASDFPGFVRFNEDHPFITPASRSVMANLLIHTDHEAFPYRGGVLAGHLIRLFSLALGALTLWGVYRAARAVAPRPGWIALAATAVTAFNPNFLFTHSMITNDVMIILLSTWAVWLSIRLARGETARWLAPALGGLVGLALLSKLSALALPGVAALALFLRGHRSGKWQEAARLGGVAAATAGLVGGWWYLRNWLLYGDPLGWDVWLMNIGVQQVTLLDLLFQFRDLAATYWQPFARQFPPQGFSWLHPVWAAAALGWLLMARRLWRNGRLPLNEDALLLAAGWFVALFVSLVRYMLITPGSSGRHLYAGVSGSSLLLVLGLLYLLRPRPARWALTAITAGLLLWSAALPFTSFAAYFPPARTTAAALPPSAPLATQTAAADPPVSLHGLHATPQTARPDEPVMVTLYWDVHRAAPPDLALLLQAWAANGALLAQADRPPAKEHYPPDLWAAGDLIRDPYSLRIDREEAAVYRIEAKLFQGDTLLMQAQTPLRYHYHPPARADNMVETGVLFGEQIRLRGYRWGPPAGEGRSLTLFWQATGPVAADYHLFLHLLDAEGQLVAQQDSPPLDGAYPTSSWPPGEVLADTYHLPLPEEGAALLGLYTLPDVSRLTAVEQSGRRLANDAFPLPLPQDE